MRAALVLLACLGLAAAQAPGPAAAPGPVAAPAGIPSAAGSAPNDMVESLPDSAPLIANLPAAKLNVYSGCATALGMRAARGAPAKGRLCCGRTSRRRRHGCPCQRAPCLSPSNLRLHARMRSRYLNVNPAPAERDVFYTFVESESENKAKDPLVVWLPECAPLAAWGRLPRAVGVGLHAEEVRSACELALSAAARLRPAGQLLTIHPRRSRAPARRAAIPAVPRAARALAWGRSRGRGPLCLSPPPALCPATSRICS